MNSPYSATIQVTNEIGQYDKSLRWTPIRIRLQTPKVILGGVSFDASCFEGDVSWVYGLIMAVEEMEGISSKMANLSVQSFFARLARKPVNTEDFTGIDIKTILETVAEVYSGTPPELFVFEDCGSGSICGGLSGNNLLEEMRLVAQAGKATLFTRHDGFLVSECWKDESDPVEIELPDEAILSASLTRGTEMGPTRIKIRGCFETQLKQGEQEFGDDQKQDPAGSKGGKGGKGKTGRGKGKQTICTRNGINQRDLCAAIKNLKGNKGDNKNADIEIFNGAGGETYQQTNETTDGELNITIGGPETGGPGVPDYMGQGDSEFDVEVTGRFQPDIEIENPGAQQGPLPGNQAQLGKGGVMIPAFTMPKGPRPGGGRRAIGGGFLPGGAGNSLAGTGLRGTGLNSALGGAGGGGGGSGGAGAGPAGGKGVVGGGGNNSNDKHADESEEIQIEITVDDPDLQDEFGVVYEQMENKYVEDRLRLEEIAIRRFQEFKMKRNAWNLDIAYMPCLRLNQVVRFRTPATIDPTDLTTVIQKTVTGLLTSINVNFDPNVPAASMSIVIESFEEIGATIYTSQGDLFGFRKRLGIDGVRWKTNAVAKAIKSVDGLTIFEGAAVGDRLEQTCNLRAGETYTLRAFGEQDGLAGLLKLEAFDVGTATLISSATVGLGTGGSPASGSHSFVAVGGDTRIRIELDTKGSSDYWRVEDWTLKRIVTK
jgi:hypothetical protein